MNLSPGSERNVIHVTFIPAHSGVRKFSKIIETKKPIQIKINKYKCL